jgi:hypothetical protein
MANVRPIVVNTEMVVLGGNMRLKAMQEAGWSEVPVQVVDWSEEKQREFIIKDNVGFGEWDWDELANTWDAEELNEWGLDDGSPPCSTFSMAGSREKGWGKEKVFREGQAMQTLTTLFLFTVIR